jgi:hypothetical protein
MTTHRQEENAVDEEDIIENLLNASGCLGVAPKKVVNCAPDVRYVA